MTYGPGKAGKCMYIDTCSTNQLVPASPHIGVVMAFALWSSAGTGSTFEISRANEWQSTLQPRVSFIMKVDTAAQNHEQVSDLRSASEHLANIRKVLNPAVADMAIAFGVSRQAIYKWIGNDTSPESEKLDRIRALSHAADAFHASGITRAPALLKMKAFDGLSLMDLVANTQLETSHVQALISEAQAMESGHLRSGLTETKAKISEDWRTELSIPGSPG